MLLLPLIQGLRIIYIYIILLSLLLWAQEIPSVGHSTMPSTNMPPSSMGLEAPAT